MVAKAVAEFEDMFQDIASTKIRLALAQAWDAGFNAGWSDLSNADVDNSKVTVNPYYHTYEIIEKAEKDDLDKN